MWLHQGTVGPWQRFVLRGLDRASLWIHHNNSWAQQFKAHPAPQTPRWGVSRCQLAVTIGWTTTTLARRGTRTPSSLISRQELACSSSSFAGGADRHLVSEPGVKNASWHLIIHLSSIMWDFIGADFGALTWRGSPFTISFTPRSVGHVTCEMFPPWKCDGQSSHLHESLWLAHKRLDLPAVRLLLTQQGNKKLPFTKGSRLPGPFIPTSDFQTCNRWILTDDSSCSCSGPTQRRLYDLVSLFNKMQSPKWPCLLCTRLDGSLCYRFNAATRYLRTKQNKKNGKFKFDQKKTATLIQTFVFPRVSQVGIFVSAHLITRHECFRRFS